MPSHFAEAEIEHLLSSNGGTNELILFGQSCFHVSLGRLEKRLVFHRGSPRAHLYVVGLFDIKHPSLPPPFFLFSSCVCFCLHGHFNCISTKLTHSFFVFLFFCSVLVSVSASVALSTVFQQSLPTPFFKFCYCVCFCLYGPFNLSLIHI